MTENVTEKKPIQMPQLLVYFSMVIIVVAIFGSLIMPSLSIGLCVVGSGMIIAASQYTITVAVMDLKETLEKK